MLWSQEGKMSVPQKLKLPHLRVGSNITFPGKHCVTSPKARPVPFNLQPHCSPYFPFISYHLLSLALITVVLGSFECLSYTLNYKLHKEPLAPSWRFQHRTEASQCFVFWWIAEGESQYQSRPSHREQKSSKHSNKEILGGCTKNFIKVCGAKGTLI